MIAISFTRARILRAAAIASLWATIGCSGPRAQFRQVHGPTEQWSEGAVRLGSLGAAGAAGYYAGHEIGDSREAGIVGAAVGAGAMWGYNQFIDARRASDAYELIEQGRMEGRSEVANETYAREAVYGVKPPWKSGTAGPPKVRSVFVPSRDVNGARYGASIQSVPIYR